MVSLDGHLSGNAIPLYLISDKGMYEVNGEVLATLNSYTFSFDKDDVTSMAILAMSSLGIKTGDSLIYGYAYQNQYGVIAIDNIVTITVK